MGPKILNFHSFDLYKGKIIPQCSLELDDSKNIYFSHVIFNTFWIKKKLYQNVNPSIWDSTFQSFPVMFRAYCLLGL